MRRVGIVGAGILALGLFGACGGDDGGGSSSGGAGGTSTGGGGTGAVDGSAATGGGGTGGTAGGGSGGASGGGGASGSGATGGAAGGGAGGTGGTGGSGGATLDCKSYPNATFDSACTSFASSYCKLLWGCAPAMLGIFGLDSEAQCNARFKLVCLEADGAPGSNVKPALYAAYADLLSTVTCTDLYNGGFAALENVTPQPECGGAGTLADGKTCYSDSQCANENCDTPSDTLCGKCTPKATLGNGCTFDSDCDTGLYCDTNDKCATQTKVGDTCAWTPECVDGSYCDSTTKKCTAAGGSGASCTNNSQCLAPLVCGSTGKCKQPAMGALGASCDPNEAQSCNSYLNLTCDKVTSKCVTNSSGNVGDKCGLVATDAGVTFVPFCNGAICVTPSGQNQGTCQKPVADGANCDPDVGPPCLFPAECVSGKCTLPNATTCAP